MKRGLSIREESFCQMFVGKAKFNGSEAARLAKYSERSARTIAARLLAKDNIQTRIRELLLDISKRNGVTADRVLKEFETLGFSRIDDYVEIEEGGGVKLKMFNKIPEQKIGAIKAIKEDRYELHDKIRPLIKLGEYTGLFDTELPPGSIPQSVHNEFKIMIMAVNGDKVKEIDFSKMIEIGKKQANVE